MLTPIFYAFHWCIISLNRTICLSYISRNVLLVVNKCIYKPFVRFSFLKIVIFDNSKHLYANFKTSLLVKMPRKDLSSFDKIQVIEKNKETTWNPFPQWIITYNRCFESYNFSYNYESREIAKRRGRFKKSRNITKTTLWRKRCGSRWCPKQLLVSIVTLRGVNVTGTLLKA